MRNTKILSLVVCGLLAAAVSACDGDDESGTSTSGTGGSPTGSGGSGGGTGGGGDTGGGGGTGGAGGAQAWNLDLLTVGLEDPARVDYNGSDGGITHSGYRTLSQSSPEFMALPMVEQDKVKKIQGAAVPLASALFQPGPEVAGTEVTGLLVQGSAGERRQRIVLKLPAQGTWNGKLVVAGTPGTRNEFASEVVFASWLVAQGYAFVSGDKGMPLDTGSLFEGTHATQHWGDMMIDMGLWARERLEAATGQGITYVYAAGLSNGGYQVRRALEIDHVRVADGEARLFAGGLAWAGVYWPDERVLDGDQDGVVTPAELAAADHVVSSTEQAALALRWAYDPATLTTPAAFMETPPYSAAHPAVTDAGYSPESAVLWGAYNTLFDALKANNPIYQGVGYWNLTAYLYRADLLGHTAAEAAAYSPFVSQANQEPPFYAYVEGATDGNWTADSVSWALKIANTAEFSAPLVEIHGDADALVGLLANGHGYEQAVLAHGDPTLHRLYVIEHGPHVDRHADGGLDYDFDGQAGEEGAADQITPMQAYAERAFTYLSGWVEADTQPPASAFVPTDAVNDVTDPAEINF